jgi:hypothetical protein
MHQQSRSYIWVYALIVFIAAALVYGLTVTSTYSGDDLQYSSLIQHHLTGDILYHPTGGQPYLSQVDKVAVAPLPINPRYLIEWPTSLLAANIWQKVGLPGTVITPIQVLRIIVGALGLVIFFLAIYRLVENIPISLLVTAGLGLTVSYWTYSIHMDQSINMVALLCLAFYIFVRQTRTGFTRSGILMLIIVLTFASLYNFTAAVSTVAFGVGVALFSQQTSLFARFQKLVGFGLIYAILVALVIAASVAIFVSPASVVDPAFWRAATFGGKPEYLISPISDAIRAAIGLGKSQILFPGIYGSLNNYFETASTTNRVMLLGYYGIILILLASPFILLAARRKQLGVKGKIALFLVIWLLAHTLFNWFWDPGFNKYWLIPLVCCWGMFALALDHIRATLTRYYRPAFSAVIAFIALSFLLNLTTQFLPDSRAQDNKWLTIATQMKTDSQPEDLFLSPGHPMDFYISFFGRRDILSASLISYDTSDNQSVLDTTFSSRIATHLADNGKIYVYGLDTLNDTQRTAFQKMLGTGTLTEKWALPGTTIYEWTPTSS